MSTVSPASTPCVRVCNLDPVTGLCLGCGRTLREIEAWGRMSEAERLSVMADLKNRTASAPRRPPERRR